MLRPPAEERPIRSLSKLTEPEIRSTTDSAYGSALKKIDLRKPTLFLPLQTFILIQSFGNDSPRYQLPHCTVPYRPFPSNPHTCLKRTTQTQHQCLHPPLATHPAAAGAQINQPPNRPTRNKALKPLALTTRTSNHGPARAHDYAAHAPPVRKRPL